MSRLFLLALGTLAGCASTPPETIEQAQERRALSCSEAGFTKDTDDWRLCLLIQQQNDRLTVMEKRLSSIELQTFGAGPIFPYRWGWY